MPRTISAANSAHRHADAGHAHHASTCRCSRRSRDKWALVRSLTHPSNDHSAGHHIMLTGRSDLPPGFNPSTPRPTDRPGIAAVAGAVTQPAEQPAAGRRAARANRPQHRPRHPRPVRRRSWAARATRGSSRRRAFEPRAYGAYPEYEFDHQERPYAAQAQGVHVPDLTLARGRRRHALRRPARLLDSIDGQRGALDAARGAGGFDRSRADAVSLLTDARVRRAFDVTRPTPRTSTATAATPSAGRC